MYHVDLRIGKNKGFWKYLEMLGHNGNYGK